MLAITSTGELSGQSGDLVSLLRELICYPGQLEKIRRELTAALYTTPLQHEQWLARIYNTLLSRYQNATVQHRNNKLPTHGITLKDCGVRLAQIGWRQSASIDAKISPLPAWRQRGVSTSSNVLSEDSRRSRAQILLDKTYIYYKRNGAHAAVRRAWSEVSKAIIKVRS